MANANRTVVTTFLLLGFQNYQLFNYLLFTAFLCIYILTLAGNALIIVLVRTVHTLKSPMYFFLSHLSLCDLLLTTNISPKMLQVIFNGGSRIYVTGCMIQFFFYCVPLAAESLLLAVMSYDRYLAICDPLHYSSSMNHRLCLHLVGWSWALSWMVALCLVTLVSNLQFCGPFIIDNYLCDLSPLLELSCSDHSIMELVDFILAIPLTLFSFVFITFTYISIFITILGVSSNTGRQKAFSTCSSHLTVVCMYFGTLTVIYIVPSKGHSFNINKLISLLYTVGTPFLNPIIYSLRNQEIKLALRKLTSSE